MAEKLELNGKLLKRGSRVTTKTGAKGWRLVRTIGDKRYFLGSLVSNITIGQGANAEQILVFRVRKSADD